MGVLVVHTQPTAPASAVYLSVDAPKRGFGRPFYWASEVKSRMLRGTFGLPLPSAGRIAPTTQATACQVPQPDARIWMYVLKAGAAYQK